MATRSLIVITIISLIIGTFGLGFSIYAISSKYTPVPINGITNTWYDYYSTPTYTNPPGNLIDVSNVFIEFEVSSGESVYFLLSAVVLLRNNDFNVGTVQVWFSIDGVRLTQPYSHVECLINNTGSDLHYFPISLQYFNSTIPSGTHNVSVIISGNYFLNALEQVTLLVQTIIE
ncbi:MAG: hypothetical protein ACTSRS_14665 [Candidatus Helarchaeota archaeon]